MGEDREQKVGAAMIQAWDRAVQNHMKYSAQSPCAGNVHDIRFLALALCGEAGELANLIKKQWRGDGKFPLTEVWAEISDVMAYTMMLAHAFDMGPEQLLRVVMEKQDAFVAKMIAIHGAEIGPKTLLSEATAPQLRAALVKASITRRRALKEG